MGRCTTHVAAEVSDFEVTLRSSMSRKLDGERERVLLSNSVNLVCTYIHDTLYTHVHVRIYSM